MRVPASKNTYGLRVPTRGAVVARGRSGSSDGVRQIERSHPMKLHLAPPGTNRATGDDTAVLDEAHVGHINGALGTITHGDTAPAGPLPQDQDPARHRGPGPHRHGRRQRRRRLQHLLAGGSELRHPPHVGPPAPRPRSLRQPGDGPAPGRRLRSRARPPHFRALRQVLGGVQRHRPLHPQRLDHRHRVHRDLARRGLPRAYPRCRP